MKKSQYKKGYMLLMTVLAISIAGYLTSIAVKKMANNQFKLALEEENVSKGIAWLMTLSVRVYWKVKFGLDSIFKMV